MSSFAFIAPTRKIQLINEVVRLLAPPSETNLRISLQNIFVKQTIFNKHQNVYFKIVYKNNVYEDSYYSNGRCVCVNLHPSLHKEMEQYLATKTEEDKHVQNIKSLMNKIFLKAKSEHDAYLLLPPEVKQKMSLTFELSGEVTVEDSFIKEFYEDNKHLLQSINERIFVSQLLGKL